MMSNRDDSLKQRIEELGTQLSVCQTEKARCEVALSEASSQAAKHAAQQYSSTKALDDAKDAHSKISIELEQLKELRAAAEDRATRAQEKANQEAAARKQQEERIEELVRKLEEQREITLRADKAMAVAKARAEAERKQLESEREEEREKLQDQISKLMKNIAKLEASMPNPDEIAADVGRKWKAKADAMVEETKSSLEATHLERVKALEKQLKEERNLSQEMKELLEKTQKAALAETNARLDALRREEQKLLESFQRTRMSQNRMLRDGSGTVELLKMYDRYFMRLREEYASLLHRIQITEAEREQRIQELLKTTRELKSYRKLRDEQYAEYLKEVRAEEESEISELVSRQTVTR
jgi:chromosome segregation ATPase